MTVNLGRRTQRTRKSMTEIMCCFCEHCNHIQAVIEPCHVTTSSANMLSSMMTNHVLLNSSNAGRTQLYKCNEACILPGQISHNWFDTYHHRSFKPDKLCALTWFMSVRALCRRAESTCFGRGEMYWQLIVNARSSNFPSPLPQVCPPWPGRF